MIYDMKAHLPNLMDKMFEDFRAGDITKLEADKTIAAKIFSDDSFNVKSGLIDDEHKKRKDRVISELESLEKSKVGLVEDLDRIEKDYWETVIGEIVRFSNKMSVAVETNE